MLILDILEQESRDNLSFSYEDTNLSTVLEGNDIPVSDKDSR